MATPNNPSTALRAVPLRGFGDSYRIQGALGAETPAQQPNSVAVPNYANSVAVPNYE